MRTRGYGTAVLLLVASAPMSGAWLPRFAAIRKSKSVFTTTSRSASPSSHDENEQEIARAWKQVDADMNRHDQEALDVWKDVRDSFQQLEQLYDKEAADLVAQLATKEAMEAAEKESRIRAAKEASEGIQMQAKLDLQQKENAREAAQEEEKPEILQAHDVVDEEAAKLVAELASLDAQAKALRESLLDSARAESEGLTMEAKVDLQLVHQAAPKKEKEVSSPQDAEVAALVAQLATQDAQELAAKESLINKAREDSQMVTMEAKIDQQERDLAKPPKEDTPSSGNDGTPSFLQAHDVVDEEAEKLVAELAFLDAQAQALRDSLIDAARAESEGLTMEAKIDQQQEHEPILFTPEEEQEAKMEQKTIPQHDAYLTMAKEMATEKPSSTIEMAANQAKKLKSQVGALEAAKFGVLIDMAKSEAVSAGAVAEKEEKKEDTPLARLAKKKTTTTKFAAVRTDAAKEEDTPIQPPPTLPTKKNTPTDEATRLLKSKLATMEAQQFALQTDMAKSDAVIADAKADTPVKVPPRAKKINTTTNYETKVSKTIQSAKEAEVLAMTVDIAKSEAVMEDIKSLELDLYQKNAEAKREKTKQAAAEAELFAMTVDIAKSEAVMEDTKSLELELHQKNAETKRMKRKQAAMEAELFAMTVDIAKSEAVMEDIKSLELDLHQKNAETKLEKSKEAAMEAELLAMTVDIARSEAVMEDTMSLELELKRKDDESKRKKTKQAAVEAELLAMTVDIAKSEAVMEDTKSNEFELEQKNKLRAAKAASVEAELQAMTVDIAKSEAVMDDLASLELELDQKNRLQADRAAHTDAEQFPRNGDVAKSEAVKADAKDQAKKTTTPGLGFGKTPRNGKAKKTTSKKQSRNGRRTKLAAEAEQFFSAKIEKARSKAFVGDAGRVIATNVVAAQGKTTVTDAVVTIAEPFFLADQNPNRDLEVIDVEALRSAASEVQKATEMLENHLPESDEKEAILRETREAADSVKREVHSHKPQPSLADTTNNATPIKKGRQVLASEQNNGGLTLEPLPQDVRNHEEDAARFFFAKRAAQEISKKEDPYLQKNNKKELSAAELAAKEHDKVDQELKELFEDVTLGFKDVTKSLARLLKPSDDGMEGQSNSTSWDGVSP